VSVNFAFTDLSDEKLAELRGLSSLTSLCVYFTNVTSEGLANLDATEMPSLQCLYVSVGQLDEDTRRMLLARFPGLDISEYELVDGEPVFRKLGVSPGGPADSP